MFFRATVVAAFALAVLATGCGGEDSSTVAPDGTGGTGGIGTGGSGGSGGSGATGGAGGTGATGGTGAVGGTGGATGVCGDGILDAGEGCDDGEANNDNLADACRSDCTQAGCGDTVIDGGESCDDGNTTGGDGCSSTCQSETTCGDGIREGAEACDGIDLAGQTCADFFHNSGRLACASDCSFDTSACATIEICNNGIDDDGDSLADCDDDDCAADIEACPSCGDGTINQPDEDCDGSEIPDGCTDHGFGAGTLGCTDLCLIDTTGCIPLEDCATPGDEDGDGAADCTDSECADAPGCFNCGNGIVQAGEACDGAAPAGQTCTGLGFDTGTVTCDAITCQVDTSGCRVFSCGDGLVMGLEECDDGNGIDGDGCSSTCIVEGDSCATPLIVNVAPYDAATRTWTVTGTTSDNTLKFDAGCAVSSIEKDEILLFTAPATGTYRIQYLSSFDRVLFVWDGVCSPTATRLACTDASPETATLVLELGQTIYIIADGYGSSTAGDEGPYTLTTTIVSACGDGIVSGHETCDLGDTRPGDGCNATCRIEAGWACDAIGCRQTTCGDNIIEGVENCEDGNSVGGDGCSAFCQVEGDTCLAPIVLNSTHRNPTTGIWTYSGSTTNMAADYASTSCGSSSGERDMVFEFTARDTATYVFDMDPTSMDDMIYVWRGGCGQGSTEIACKDTGSTSAVVNAGETIYIVADGYGTDGLNHGTFTLTVEEQRCNNGFISGPENCEDGNILPGDGCSDTCVMEPGWKCVGPVCTRIVCGDGIIEGSETCEDGNTVDGDGCSASCITEGNNCLAPIVLDNLRNPTSGAWVYNGSTSQMTSDYQSTTCGSSVGEREMVFSLTVPDSGRYTFDVTDNPHDDMLYVWRGACGQGSQEIACVDTGSTFAQLTAGEVIYIVADGYNSGGISHGPFRLNVVAEICGNGFVTSGEACDDRNLVAGDGCSPTCQVEPGWSCIGVTCHRIVCGDGIRDASEQCDDGNQDASDGCDNCVLAGDTCANPFPLGRNQFDPVAGRWTFSATTTGMTSDYGSTTCSSSGGQPDMVFSFTPVLTGRYVFDIVNNTMDDMLYVWRGACGAGSTEIACVDTGNTSAVLTGGETVYIVVDGWGTSGGHHGPFTLNVDLPCGNGSIDAGEQCDDGAHLNGDGCSDTCMYEPGWTCTGSVCRRTSCGDGVQEGSEECDDGNQIAGDGCSATCTTDGDTCANAPDITNMSAGRGFWLWSGATWSHTNDFTGTCNASAEADVVGMFVAPTTGTYDLTLDSTFDAVLYAWRGACGQGSIEAACVDIPDETGDEYASVSLTAGETMYVVIDGYSNSGGAEKGWFNLEIAEAVCGDGRRNLSEACDDGNTTSGDGCSAICELEWLPETEPNGSTQTANPILFGTTGAISPAGDFDYFSFNARAGTTYAFETVTSPSFTCGSTGAEDMTLQVWDSSGVSRGIDFDSGIGWCSYLTYTPTTDGTHYVSVEGNSSSTVVPIYYLWMVSL